MTAHHHHLGHLLFTFDPQVNPRTLEVELIGPTLGADFSKNALPKGKFKWLRGIVAADPLHGADAAIYALPCNASAVLKIVPRTGSVSTMKEWVDPLSGKRKVNPVLSGVFKYHGGVLAADGNIYAIPATGE